MGAGVAVKNLGMARRWRRETRHALLACLLLLVTYFVIPVKSDPDTTRLVARSAVTVLLVAAVAWLVTRQVRREFVADSTGAEPEVRSLARLAVGLVGGLLAFALADYVISRTPGQFANLETRIDALYFALSTLTTIGFGDVHARGQVARAAVCVQMVFSIGVLATGVSVLVRRLLPGRPPGPPPAGPPSPTMTPRGPTGPPPR
ncbi:potassium channel family protein [Micromonospora sp. NPDC126480]|uniref:potassium channel family protein n=1 Tax=Micromonospora sp. NPDC126480 TaxID=3155312 RepID=UPI003322B2ED